MFCVIRHPDVAVLGTCAESALPHHQAQGWVRVSEWRAEPSLFHLPDFAEAVADLDAPAPEPARPAKTTKEK